MNGTEHQPQKVSQRELWTHWFFIFLFQASQTAESVSDPVVGGIYLSQYSVDNAWYRTVVESISGDHVSVCFIDYGNREVALASGLKKLPTNLAQESLKVCPNHILMVKQINKKSSLGQTKVLYFEMNQDTLIKYPKKEKFIL